MIDLQIEDMSAAINTLNSDTQVPQEDSPTSTEEVAEVATEQESDSQNTESAASETKQEITIPKRRLDKEIAKRKALEKKLEEYEAAKSKDKTDNWDVLDKYLGYDDQSADDPTTGRLDKIETMLMAQSIKEETRAVLKDHPDIPEHAIYQLIANTGMDVEEAVDAWLKAAAYFGGQKSTVTKTTKPKLDAPVLPRSGVQTQPNAKAKEEPATFDEARELMIRAAKLAGW